MPIKYIKKSPKTSSTDDNKTKEIVQKLLNDLPKPIINKGGCNLSFAGLKTAVLKISKSIKEKRKN